MKKLIRIPFSCAFLLLLPFISIQAQEEQEKHEVSICGGAGISTLKYSLSTGDYEFGFGGNVGLDYGYFFNNNIGIRTGIEVSFYNSKAMIGSVVDQYITNDGVEAFEFRSEVSNYNEKQHATFIDIPLMLQFQHPVFCCNGHLFYLALGGKVGFPVRSTYESSGATYVTSAYYAQNNTLLNGPGSRGLGTFTEKGTKKDMDLNTAYMLSTELGMKWMVAESYSFYTGIYCDYGLNDVSTGAKQPFLVYNSVHPSDLFTNSVWNSKYTQNGKTENFTGKVTPIAIGLKLRFTFRVPD